ncbi:MAG: hypothetical protein AAF224_00050 [Pseudomonadota bacterium]
MKIGIKKSIFFLVKAFVAAAPILICMYALYWLSDAEIWTPTTAYRDIITIVVVATGMTLSFILSSRIYGLRK